MITIEYALDGNNEDKLININLEEVVSRRKSNNYKCLLCEEVLTVKKKEKNRIKQPHFSHRADSKCKLKDFSNKEARDIYSETLLHRKAKEYFENEKEIFIPKKQIYSLEKIDLEGKTFPAKKQEVLSKKYTILEAKFESNEGNVKPDIKLKVVGINEENVLEEFELFVEIAVTHFVDEEKRIKLQKANKNCIEIDLQNFDRELVNNEEEVIKEIKNYKRYTNINFFYPGEDRIKNKLNLEYDIELDIENEKIKNKREKIFRTAKDKNSNIIFLEDLKEKEEVKCLICSENLHLNENHFKHNQESNCDLLNKVCDMEEFKNIFIKNVLFYTMRTILQDKVENNIFYSLPERKFDLEKQISLKDDDGWERKRIKEIPYFENNAEYKVLNFNHICINNKKIFKVNMDNSFNNITLYCNLSFNDKDYLHLDNYSFKEKEYILNIKCFNFIEKINLDNISYFELKQHLTSYSNYWIKPSKEEEDRLQIIYLKKWTDNLAIINQGIKDRKIEEEKQKEIQRLKELERQEQIRIEQEKKLEQLRIAKEEKEKKERERLEKAEIERKKREKEKEIQDAKNLELAKEWFPDWYDVNPHKDINENDIKHTQENLEDPEDIIIKQIEVICLKEDNKKLIEVVKDSTKTTKEVIDNLKKLGANIIKKENEK